MFGAMDVAGLQCCCIHACADKDGVSGRNMQSLAAFPAGHSIHDHRCKPVKVPMKMPCSWPGRQAGSRISDQQAMPFVMKLTAYCRIFLTLPSCTNQQLSSVACCSTSSIVYIPTLPTAAGLAATAAVGAAAAAAASSPCRARFSSSLQPMLPRAPGCTGAGCWKRSPMLPCETSRRTGSTEHAVNLSTSLQRGAWFLCMPLAAHTHAAVSNVFPGRSAAQGAENVTSPGLIK
jgi:hypothetical protein